MSTYADSVSVHSFISSTLHAFQPIVCTLKKLYVPLCVGGFFLLSNGGRTKGSERKWRWAGEKLIF